MGFEELRQATRRLSEIVARAALRQAEERLAELIRAHNDGEHDPPFEDDNSDCPLCNAGPIMQEDK